MFRNEDARIPADSRINHGDLASPPPLSRVRARALKFWGALASCAAIAVCNVYIATSIAQQSGKESQLQAGTVASASSASPIYGVSIPPGYRDWKVISVNHLVTDKIDQLRAQLGNDIAIKAFREGKRPFPDGAVIVAVHWNHVPSEENDRVLGGPFPGARSFVAGSAVNIQVMVKDSKKYASTGGWGFADFKDGKPGDEALHKTCFGCHEPAKARDFVFAHYAPTP